VRQWVHCTATWLHPVSIKLSKAEKCSAISSRIDHVIRLQSASKQGNSKQGGEHATQETTATVICQYRVYNSHWRQRTCLPASAVQTRMTTIQHADASRLYANSPCIASPRWLSERRGRRYLILRFSGTSMKIALLPARRSKCGLCYTATCLSIRPSVTAGIVSKRLHLS